MGQMGGGLIGQLPDFRVQILVFFIFAQKTILLSLMNSRTGRFFYFQFIFTKEIG